MMRFALFLGVSLTGCGGSLLDGGEAHPAGEAPSGRVVAVFERAACVDAAGSAVPTPDVRVALIVPDASEPLLLEQRLGYDSLLVRNGERAGSELVFRVISAPDDGQSALHEYRIEWPQVARGRFASALEFERTAFRGGFRAHGARPALLCQLVPVGGTARPDLDRRSRVGYENARAGATAGVAHQGTPWR